MIKTTRKSLKILMVLLVGFVGVAAVSDHSKYFEISKNIEIFTNLYKEINTYYVDEIDPAKLMRTGLDAMLESLDPYTNYISESEIEGFRFMTEGKYNGIGASIREVEGDITVIAPYKDCPADKAGLKAGDILLEIDGKSTKGRKSDDIMDILKGYPGTDVVLTIKRPGTSKNLKLTLTRDEVKVPNVPYSGMVSDDVGYVALTTFTREAGKNVGNAVKKLKEENPDLKGVIFDLRGNGGGLLTEAVNVSNVFIPKNEVVVTTKGKVVDWDRSFKTLNNPIDQEIPLVVVIDKNSASASEIVSGVIQDLDRGILMGQRSYGKGLVQNTRDVGYNSKVKLTTAKYYIPSGRCIQGVKYEDGEPVDIPDEERTAFKTRAGRKVLDGGGVKPDILLDEESNFNIIKSLKKKFLIFKYATEYAVKHESIGDAKDFRFTDFEDFLTFLEKSDFEYDTDGENALKQLKKYAKDERYYADVKADIETIEEKINKDKKNQLMKHKAAIVNLLEKEIVSRYHYQKGKILIGLRNDKEISDAVTLLGNRANYDSVLKK